MQFSAQIPAGFSPLVLGWSHDIVVFVERSLTPGAEAESRRGAIRLPNRVAAGVLKIRANKHYM